MNEKNKSGKSGKGDERSSAPSISLPRGGGAIRGMGEKFSANPVTGTGSFSVPIATTPGRSGFGPGLSLSYDSGSGNGPFGYGWNLSLPSITRKTEKGLPEYRDEYDSDIFILSGAEDLVPVLRQKGDAWVQEDIPDRVINTEIYNIKRYYPRIEGLFARIERWTNARTNEIHWRSISKDNITTIYGRTDNSRIRDPNLPENSPRIFSWLICESYDDRGNVISYEYEPENSAGINLFQTNERNRKDKSRSANRYLKRIKYGNKTPVKHAPPLPREFTEDISNRTDWLFEVVFDYGEGHYEELPAGPGGYEFVNARPEPVQDWQKRPDPFSSYRAGFEVRTYRFCHRVLMFHHFPDELGVDNCLVRATEFKYKNSPVASFITSITQSGFKYQKNGSFLKKSLPPLEFEYSQAIIRDKVQKIDKKSLENLPQGLDSAQYQWVDIDGEGLSGILTEQGDSWFYKRNISALPSVGQDGKSQAMARFGPMKRLARIPSFNNISKGHLQLLDVAGDGQLDVVVMDGPTPGFYERTTDRSWHTFKPFKALPNISWQDPNLKFVDLTGNGHTDIFITGAKAFTWYPSLAEKGFAPGEKVRQVLDEEKGPKLVFADNTESVYLADMSGDGLSDLIRIRNGDVCYWPNLGYGRFGPKVTMDNSPCFDTPDQFNQRCIRLADIDGSGTTDILYLGYGTVSVYLNQSGNTWSDCQYIRNFPKVDNLSSVTVVDLKGNGTACIVWSSPLPSANGQQMHYIDLMGDRKPHLLSVMKNNMGAETRVQYASSTKFYLQDYEKGESWITRLPFPVHVVECVETYDRISRNRFVTRYAYHHGYFDGIEREFRGFGMVEQWDTEEIGIIQGDITSAETTNLDKASHVPPVLTRTWFHTGAYIKGEKISRHYEKEYFREPSLSDDEFSTSLLPDIVLPDEITLPDNTGLSQYLGSEEIRQACRALKGSILRQEVYAQDGSDLSDNPYTVLEQNHTIMWLQPQGTNPHAVFFVHPRETINYHYERHPADPRTGHELILDIDAFGNVLKSVNIGYGRRKPDITLVQADQDKQTTMLITYTENKYTNSVGVDDNYLIKDDYRTPLLCETRTYEITGLSPPAGRRFTLPYIIKELSQTGEISYEEEPSGDSKQKRLIEHTRAIYRSNNLSAPLLLGKVESLALPYDSYKLAFTRDLLKQTFVDSNKISTMDLAALLSNKGGYLTSEKLKTQGVFPDTDPDKHWWIPSGRVYYSADKAHTPAQELAFAEKHFFIPHQYRNPFSQTTTLQYDHYDLLLIKATGPLGNVTTVVITDDQGNELAALDYRVMQPWMVVDPNMNRTAVAFDVLGLVVGTAVMGKAEKHKGDSLKDFKPDLNDSTITKHIRIPFTNAHDILKHATTRLIYDLGRYKRTSTHNNPQPNVVYTMARETHVSELSRDQKTKIQHSFLYSDGFGREIQTKIQAESGNAPQRKANTVNPDIPGPLILQNGKPRMAYTDKRWVGTGRVIYNNKGKPVKKYEPFFSATHLHEDESEVTMTGVTPILFYDPVGRVVATLYPNHTYEKVVFDQWRVETWDVNDTVLLKPDEDSDVKDFFKRLNTKEYLPTWYNARKNGQLGEPEKNAAIKTGKHGATPGVAFLDTLGREFLQIADNGRKADQSPLLYETRIDLDIEGNLRCITDARGNKVMQYTYDMLGDIIKQVSTDAGSRWILDNVAENPVREWDERDHIFMYNYDELQRPVSTCVKGGDGPVSLSHITAKTKYGDWKDMTEEQRTRSQSRNLIGKPKMQWDTAGRISFEAYDFKGNLLKKERRLAKEYKNVTDWNKDADAGLREAEPFRTETSYDALNRVTYSKTPDKSITILVYNEANLLEKVEVIQNGVATHFVENIDYNTRGQRTAIKYGNDVETTYVYDKDTYRLTHLQTKKSGNTLLQDLYYMYDPAGDITRVEDKSIPTVFFNNQKIEGINTYTYDPLYRLVEATGREYMKIFTPFKVDNWKDAPFLKKYTQGTAMEWRKYTQHYTYDEAGNIEQVKHVAGNGSWTRKYTYETGNNRLIKTEVGANTYTYTHHGKHGFITSMPHLQVMRWNFNEELQAGAAQRRTDGGTPETTYYTYDSGGQRVRKVTELSAAPGETPALKNERIYVDGTEVYREYQSGQVNLERKTLHVMDDKQRIAIIETRTRGDDGSPALLTRYQLGNHLGSVSLETDENARVISYEEYHPNGTTAYQAVDKEVKAAAKRFKYTGKERDKETGFSYHGARYYAPWLGRWVSCDPAGMVDGVNLYTYTKNNPILYIDYHGKKVATSKSVIEIDPGLPEKSYPQTISVSKNLVRNLWDVQKDIIREGKSEIRERAGIVLSNATLFIIPKKEHIKMVPDPLSQSPNLTKKMKYFKSYLKNFLLLSFWGQFHKDSGRSFKRKMERHAKSLAEIDFHTHPALPMPSDADIAHIASPSLQDTRAASKMMVVASDRIYFLIATRKAKALQKDNDFYTAKGIIKQAVESYKPICNQKDDIERFECGGERRSVAGAETVGVAVYILYKNSTKFVRYLLPGKWRENAKKTQKLVPKRIKGR